MRWRLTAMAAVAAVVLFVVGYQLTRGILIDADTAASNTPEISSPGMPASRKCGRVASTDVTGQALDPFWLDQVRAVHNAACRRDYTELVHLMDNPFRNKPPSAVVDNWRAADPDGVRLDILSALLETRGKLDQGGLIFCQADGIVAFARGTQNRPGKWSEFAIFAFHETTELTSSFIGCG